jgi:hypothetical protein
MSEEDTRRKQNYLRTEILEKGYDPNKFVEYLSSKRENGEEIENWSVLSLEEAVKDYVSVVPPPQNPPQVIPDSELSDVETSPNHPKDAKLHTKSDDKSEEEEGTAASKELPEVSQIEQQAMADTLALKATTDYSTVNDQRQQITQMILSQSEEEKAGMNDFTFNIAPLKKTFLNELNGERRLKVTVTK